MSQELDASEGDRTENIPVLSFYFVFSQRIAHEDEIERFLKCF